MSIGDTKMGTELKLQLGDPTKQELLNTGLQKYNAGERDHPAARYWIDEDIKGQRLYEATRRQAELSPNVGETALQLVFFGEV